MSPISATLVRSRGVALSAGALRTLLHSVPIPSLCMIALLCCFTFSPNGGAYSLIMSKKLSGCQFRKRRLQEEKRVASQRGALLNYVRAVNSPSSSELNEADNNKRDDALGKTDSSSKHDEIQTNEPKPQDTSRSQLSTDKKTDALIQTFEVSEKVKSVELDFNNPKTWINDKEAVTEEVRTLLVEHGPERGNNSDYSGSVSEGGRSFTKEWFFKRMPNGEKLERKWLMYSEDEKAVYCFPCVVFGYSQHCLLNSTASGYARVSRPAITDPTKGFKDWKHLPRINDHENSLVHKECYIKWKTYEKNLMHRNVIDHDLEKAILNEKERWRHILKVFLDAILFCAQNNIALRGTNEIIGEPSAGIFLNLIELIGRYDSEVKHLITKHKKGQVHYLSPAIQNEFISKMAEQVRSVILAEVKKAKYFSFLFDCTADISHQEQMCEVIRYVNISEKGRISVEERFLDFIESHEKSGIGLAQEILEKLAKDGLDIMDARGQGYDNGSNMSGKYSGVQAHIINKNSLAVYVPCVAHSLNLVGVHAASISPKMKTFFGTVQRLFTFFSSSVARWSTLMKCLKVTLKKHSDTRWSSKATAIKALYSQLPQVVTALQELSEDVHPDTVYTARTLLHQIDFRFVCFLALWNVVLDNVDRVNQALQSKSISVEKAAQLIEGLRNSIERVRNYALSDVLEEAKVLVESQLSAVLDIQPIFPTKRKRKNEEIPDDDGSVQFKMLVNQVLDTLISQLNWRCTTLKEVNRDFGFLWKTSELSSTDLKRAASDLAVKYCTDLDASELSCEVESFKGVTNSMELQSRTTSPLELLQFIYDYALAESYPNIVIAVRIFLTLPVTVASCERSFSKLKLAKNYLRSTMGQERLSSLALLSIENGLAKGIDFDEIIDNFASVKARKIHLK